MELRGAAAEQGRHAGKSIIETLWEQADAQYAKLRELHNENGPVTADTIASQFEDGMSKDNAEEASAEVVDYLQTQGKVQALCFALGSFLLPYGSAKEKIDHVRPMLKERYEADLDEDDEEDGDDEDGDDE